MAPSRSGGGILNSQWRNIGFGDGFHAYPDPTAPDIVGGTGVERLPGRSGEQAG